MKEQEYEKIGVGKLANEVADDFKRHFEKKPTIYDKFVAFVGAGMGAETGLCVGSTAIERIKKRLILEEMYFEEIMPVIKSEKLTMEEKETSIRKRLSERNLISRQTYGKALDDLKQGTGVSGVTEDFEMQMEALCQGHGMENAVRRELVSLFSSKYNVTFSYEIIAQLLEQDIFDGIVNFNFDEQLDDAIARNLRFEQYAVVVSDGDFVPGSDKKMYIRPHGTVGHPSSMRFRKRDYSFISDGVLAAVDELLEGKTALLVAGFGMQSIEINELIRRKIEETAGSEFPFEPYFFFVDFDVPEFSIPGVDDTRKKLLTIEGKSHEDINPGSEIIPRLYADLRQAINNTGIAEIDDTKYAEALAHHCTNLMRDARPETINVAGEAEAKDPCDNKNELPSYLYLRAAMGLAGTVARAKGYLNLDTLARTHLGYAYSQYAESCDKSEPKAPIRSLVEMCTDLGMINPTHAPEAFMIGRNEIDSTRGQVRHQIAGWLTRNLPVLADAHGQHAPEAERMRKEFQRRFDNGGSEKLRTAFLELLGMSAKDIVNVPGNETSLVYPSLKEHIRSLRDFNELTREIREAIKKDNWNELWLLFRSGEWFADRHWEDLRRRIVGGDPITIRAICSETRFQPVFGELLRERISKLPEAERKIAASNLTFEEQFIPATGHNRLLYCWAERTDDKVSPRKAIYSPMSDRQHYISPVVIDSNPVEALNDEEQHRAEADLTNIATLFNAYRSTAKAEKERQKRRKQTRYRRKSELRDEIEGRPAVERMINDALEKT